MPNIKELKQIYGDQEIPRFEYLNQSTEKLANCRRAHLMARAPRSSSADWSNQLKLRAQYSLVRMLKPRRTLHFPSFGSHLSLINSQWILKVSLWRKIRLNHVPLFFRLELKQPNRFQLLESAATDAAWSVENNQTGDEPNKLPALFIYGIEKKYTFTGTLISNLRHSTHNPTPIRNLPLLLLPYRLK